jgi:hypothetical protein
MSQANVLWWVLMGETLTISWSSVSEAVVLAQVTGWGVDTLLGPEGIHVCVFVSRVRHRCRLMRVPVIAGG